MISSAASPQDERIDVRAKRLRRLAALIGAKRYLEIGVFRGETFFKVPVPSKTAVDPVFEFDREARASEGVQFHQMPSDAFFARHDCEPFDLIYLDGLHTVEQTLRDLLASFRFAHPKTIWLLDDTVPNDEFSTLKDKALCNRLRRSLGNSDRQWMGDVFKTVYFIADMMPHLSYATFTGHGQTVVWQEVRRDFTPAFNDLEATARASFARFVETRDRIMNFMSDDEIYQRVERFAGEARAS